MIEVICYGDSNTYGYCPIGSKARYDKTERWTGILQERLGIDFMIREEGKNGRTTDLDDPYDFDRNGAKYLPNTLRKYPKADILILMLGTNDLKEYFQRVPKDIADAAGRLVKTAQSIMKEGAKILLVSPVLIGEGMAGSPFGSEFGAMRSRTMSLEFAKLYAEQAENLQVMFMDAAKYACVSKEDSLHLGPEGHKALAEAFEKKIREIEWLV